MDETIGFYAPPPPPTIWQRLGFHGAPFPRPAENSWSRDEIYLRVKTRLSWSDRFRALASGTLEMACVIETENPPGRTRSICVTSVSAPEKGALP